MNLHIGYFQSGFPVPDGTTTAVHGLSLGLARRGLKVTIYGCGPQDELKRLRSHPNLNVQIVPGLSRRGFAVPSVLTDRIARNIDGIDLLVVNTMFNPPCVSVAKAARTGSIPYLASPHDPYHPQLLRKNWFRKRVYTALFERPLLRRAAGVQVLSAEHARWLNQFSIGTVVVIPNGFWPEDADSSDEADKTDSNLQGTPRFLCLGRMDAHHKGLDLLVRGFASALRSRQLPPGAVINFAGRGAEDVPMLTKLAAAEGVTGQINFIGEVNDSTRHAMFRDCDAFLLCSRYDGFGLVALEAMLAAKPIVVSRQAGIAAWVQKAGAGILAEPSVDGIQSALAECMSRQREWTTLGENGRSYARQHLTWDRVASHAADCYAQLIKFLQDSPLTGKSMRIIGVSEDGVGID